MTLEPIIGSLLGLALGFGIPALYNRYLERKQARLDAVDRVLGHGIQNPDWKCASCRKDLLGNYRGSLTLNPGDLVTFDCPCGAQTRFHVNESVFIAGGAAR
jgi:hypothetical protein